MSVVRNPFKVMGLTPSFRLDARELEQRQRDLSKALHPDRHASGSPSERRNALSEAILVNDAFRVLRDPVTRAEALLRLLGLPTGSEGETRTQLPPLLLMEVMEQREQLGLARRARDKQALQTLTQKAQAEQAELEGVLGDTLGAALRSAQGAETLAGTVVSSSDAKASAAPELETAAQALARLRYVRKLLEEAAAVEDDLDAS